MRSFHNLFRLAGELFRTSPVASLGASFALIMVGLAPLAELRIFSRLIDVISTGVTGAGDFSWRQALGWLAWFVGVKFLTSTAQRVVVYLKATLRQGAEQALTRRILDKAGTVRLLTIESPAFHDSLSRAQRAVGEHLEATIDSTETVLRQIMQVLSVLLVLISYQWAAGVVLLIGGIPSWALQGYMANMHVQLYRSQTEKERRADYFAGLLQQRSFVKEIRLFGLGSELVRLWREEYGSLLPPRLAIGTKRGVYQLLTRITGHLSFVVSLGMLGLAGIRGRLSIGQVGSVIKATQDLQVLASNMIINVGLWRQNAGFLDDIWAFLDLEELRREAIDREQSGQAESPVSVEFDAVSFSFPGGASPTIKGMSFRTGPGELVALVGENGAGKSTLVKLLLGLYPPTTGRLVLAGEALNPGEAPTVRARMATVFQDYLRYSLTAGENIGVGEVSALADEERIRAAAALAGADGVVSKLDKGYNTLLGREFDGGVDLSGGEWQRVATARAFMRQASIVILDEPTAALDPIAELEVFKRFKELIRGRTAFFVSHRLGAARLADRVFVLKEGELVEVGTHTELIRRQGEYARLFESQAHWYK